MTTMTRKNRKKTTPVDKRQSIDLLDVNPKTIISDNDNREEKLNMNPC